MVESSGGSFVAGICGGARPHAEAYIGNRRECRLVIIMTSLCCMVPRQVNFENLCNTIPIDKLGCPFYRLGRVFTANTTAPER